MSHVTQSSATTSAKKRFTYYYAALPIPKICSQLRFAPQDHVYQFLKVYSVAEHFSIF